MQEFFREATYYGTGKIMRLYSSFPRWLALPVSIQHGWAMSTSPVHAVEKAPENWYWSVAAEQRYANAYPKISTRPSGAPFLYLLQVLGYTPLPTTAQQGSIVFPSHSTFQIDMVCDFDHYAAQLAALPEQYHPITVCLYYTDHERGLAEPFLRHGFPVVTNGQTHLDDAFLWNFVQNVHGQRYIFSNQMSSSLLFGAAMNLTAHFWGPEFQVFNPNKFWEQRDFNQYHRGWEATYREVFRFPDPDLAHQKQVVEAELGKAQMLSPRQMRSLLWRLTLHAKYRNQFVQPWVQFKKTKIQALRQTGAWQAARQLRHRLRNT